MLLPDRYQRPPWPLHHPNFQTIYARLLRRVKPLTYHRERVELLDGDFFDLDLALSGQRRIALICHGLESCSRARYVHGIGRSLMARGWDVAAMNFRGCGGEPNRLLRSYHSGETGDLAAAINHLNRHHHPESIALIGFSLGGNVVLKYMGEQGGGADPHVVAAVAVSVPCDLGACAAKMAEPSNSWYMKRFLKHLRDKTRRRREAFPGALDYDAIDSAQTFAEFDGLYTAPVHGFESARDYWEQCSARRHAAGIRVPTLLINSRDDPFLTDACHLTDIAKDHRWLDAETTAHGGHVAFLRPGRPEFYHDLRAAEFLESHCPGSSDSEPSEYPR